MSKIIYADAKIKHTLTFPTDSVTGLQKWWSDYTYVHIKCYHKDTGTLLQTSGYPSGQGDNDLYVPNTSAGVCYVKLDAENTSNYKGALEWEVVSRETDTGYEDGTYDPSDKKTELILQ